MKKSTVKFLKEVWAFLEGKKTYIAMAIVAVTMFVRAQGWISELTSENLMVLFSALGIAALRSSIK